MKSSTFPSTSSFMITAGGSSCPLVFDSLQLAADEDARSLQEITRGYKGHDLPSSGDNIVDEVGDPYGGH